MATIVSLAPEHLDCVTAWFETEWPDYYATQPPGTARATFEAIDHAWLVAIECEEPVGVVAIRPLAIETDSRFSPGLGGLYVPPNARRRGLGSKLIDAAAHVARAQGHRQLYAATASAQVLFVRCGWCPAETVIHHGEPLDIYAKSLA